MGFYSHVSRTISSRCSKTGWKNSTRYRTNCDDMQTSEEVLEKKMKQLKSSRENDLFHRQNNIINNHLTHKCCGYYFIETKLPRLFDPLQGKEDNPNRFMLGGSQMINI